MNRTFSVKQVAQILGYSTNSIYTFLKERRIKGVRVGKGRFRIPQSEIDRLIGQKQQQNPLQSMHVSSNAEALNSTSPELLESESGILLETPLESRVEMPGIFDWFAGMSSILLGSAMFLFSSAFEEFSFNAVSQTLPVIRTALISSGFGLILSDIVGKRKSPWHWMFHWILSVSVLVYAYVLYANAQIESAVIYGVLAVVFSLYRVLGINGLTGFTGYIGLLFTSLAAFAFIHPGDSTLVEILSALSVPSNLVRVILLGGSGILLLNGLFGPRMRKGIFGTMMIVISAIMTMIAVYYAEHLLWGRSLFMVLSGIMAFFVPVWQELSFQYKRDRRFVFGVFGSILVLLLGTIAVVRVIQTSIVGYAQKDLENKASFGSFALKEAFSDLRGVMLSTASNLNISEWLAENDSASVTQFFKTLFETNTVVRSIVLLNADGHVVSAYPLTTEDFSRYAASEYVVRAKSTGEQIIADMFESVSDTIKRKVVLVVTPIRDKDGSYAGSILGFMGMDTFGNTLSQIVSAGTDERVFVTDRNNKIAYHPDGTQVGIESDENSFVRDVLKHGDYDGDMDDRMIVSFNSVPVVGSWKVYAAVPVTSMLQVTSTANGTMATVIFLSLLIITVFMLSHRVRYPVSEQSGLQQVSVNHEPNLKLPASSSPEISIGKSKKKKGVST